MTSNFNVMRIDGLRVWYTDAFSAEERCLTRECLAMRIENLREHGVDTSSEEAALAEMNRQNAGKIFGKTGVD